MQEDKDKLNDFMQKLVKLLKNSSYGKNIRKNIAKEYSCNTEHWMSARYDERVLDYQRLADSHYIVRMQQGEGLECKTDLKHTLPAHLGSGLSNSKRTINCFIRETNGFKTNNVFLYRYGWFINWKKRR